jgi:multidrug efflux system outer membrane protein
VLDAQRSLYAAEDELVQSEKNVVVSLIALYKSLGGGWSAGSGRL